MGFAHPDITVRPMTRPCPVAYIGRDDFRMLVNDLSEALGPIRVVGTTLSTRGRNRHRHRCSTGPRLRAGREQQRFVCEFTFRGGLVYTFDSHTAPKSA